MKRLIHPRRGFLLAPHQAILIAALILTGSCKGDPIELKRLEKPSPFTLHDQNGQPYHYEPMAGKVRLIFFGYTSCPDFCPTTLSKLERAWLSLPFPESERPEVIFVSIDPDRDTAPRLKTYLAAFHIPIVGITGPKKELDPIARDFGTYFRIEKKGDEVIVDHSTYVYLIDQEGTVRHHLKTSDTPERISETIRTLYAETN